MISEEKAVKYLKESNSNSEFARKLGYSYYNGRVSKKVKKIFEEYGLEPNFDRNKNRRKYERIEKECPICEETFIAKKDHPDEKQTCSYSCSNKYFEHGQGEEASKKKSESLKEYYQKNEHHNKGKTKDRCNIHSYKKCTVCEGLFVVANAKKQETGFGTGRTTCSEECKVRAQVKVRTYQNGSRKPEYYHNKNTDEEVLLESSWEVEVAELLDELNITWTRPDPIPWKDEEEKEHYYYPDFFLPDYTLYLDPKNPYCMERDKKKMDKISEKIDIRYGNLEHIKNIISKRL